MGSEMCIRDRHATPKLNAISGNSSAFRIKVCEQDERDPMLEVNVMVIQFGIVLQ